MQIWVELLMMPMAALAASVSQKDINHVSKVAHTSINHDQWNIAFHPTSNTDSNRSLEDWKFTPTHDQTKPKPRSYQLISVPEYLAKIGDYQPPCNKETHEDYRLTFATDTNIDETVITFWDDTDQKKLFFAEGSHGQIEQNSVYRIIGCIPCGHSYHTIFKDNGQDGFTYFPHDYNGMKGMQIEINGKLRWKHDGKFTQNAYYSYQDECPVYNHINQYEENLYQGSNESGYNGSEISEIKYTHVEDEGEYVGSAHDSPNSGIISEVYGTKGDVGYGNYVNNYNHTKDLEYGAYNSESYHNLSATYQYENNSTYSAADHGSDVTEIKYTHVEDGGEYMGAGHNSSSSGIIGDVGYVEDGNDYNQSQALEYGAHNSESYHNLSETDHYDDNSTYSGANHGSGVTEVKYTHVEDGGENMGAGHNSSSSGIISEVYGAKGDVGYIEDGKDYNKSQALEYGAHNSESYDIFNDTDHYDDNSTYSDANHGSGVTEIKYTHVEDGGEYIGAGHDYSSSGIISEVYGAKGDVGYVEDGKKDYNQSQALEYGAHNSESYYIFNETDHYDDNSTYSVAEHGNDVNETKYTHVEDGDKYMGAGHESPSNGIISEVSEVYGAKGVVGYVKDDNDHNHSQALEYGAHSSQSYDIFNETDHYDDNSTYSVAEHGSDVSETKYTQYMGAGQELNSEVYAAKGDVGNVMDEKDSNHTEELDYGPHNSESYDIFNETDHYDDNITYSGTDHVSDVSEMNHESYGEGATKPNKNMDRYEHKKDDAYKGDKYNDRGEDESHQNVEKDTKKFVKHGPEHIIDHGQEGDTKGEDDEDQTKTTDGIGGNEVNSTENIEYLTPDKEYEQEGLFQVYDDSNNEQKNPTPSYRYGETIQNTDTLQICPSESKEIVIPGNSTAAKYLIVFQYAVNYNHVDAYKKPNIEAYINIMEQNLLEELMDYSCPTPITYTNGRAKTLIKANANADASAGIAESNSKLFGPQRRPGRLLEGINATIVAIDSAPKDEITKTRKCSNLQFGIRISLLTHFS